jgi:hypothetical protein
MAETVEQPERALVDFDVGLALGQRGLDHGAHGGETGKLAGIGHDQRRETMNAFHGKCAEVLVEPRAPASADQIAGLQQATMLPARAALDDADVPALRRTTASASSFAMTSATGTSITRCTPI